MPTPNPRSDFAAFVAATMVLMGVSFAIAACGGDDLFFPAELPATATEERTSTPTPEDDDS